MLTLYRCGRQADALDAYQRVYQLLDEELAVQPGYALQQLHHQILTADPALAPPAAISPTGAKMVVPRQLPAPPQMFTGRTVELATLDRIADPSTMVITAIDGMAGIGKTALAVHAGHQLAGRFPDGQLFIDLRGFTAGAAQVQAGDALDRLLREMGVPGERIPAGLDERAGLWRSLVARRRMLIVLDNAATEAQVKPLLPAAAGSLVLVTSRRRLTALEATSALSLDTLPEADAVELFIRTAGRPELAVDTPHSAAELEEVLTLCGRLPLRGLGAVQWMLGRLSEATDSYQQVLEMARQLGEGNWQYEALQGLGRLNHLAGHPDLALTYHEQALQLAADLAQPSDQARAHDGLAHAYHTMGQPDQARRHWQHALDILIDLGTGRTEETQVDLPNIRSHLTNLGTPQ